MAHKHGYGRGGNSGGTNQKRRDPTPIPEDPTHADPARAPYPNKQKNEELIKMSPPARFVWLRTYWRKYKAPINSERVMAAFTVVIAFAALLQLWVFFKQLEAMRIDQRAWLAVKQQPTTWDMMTIGNIPSLTLSLENTGKTPAITVKGDFFIEYLPIDTRPNFKQQGTHASVSAGAIPPNAPQPVPVYRFLRTSSADNPTGIKLTQDEQTALKEHRTWYVVHGSVTYWDVFGVTHFTHFCMYQAEYRPKDAIATECSSHNDVDHD